jgi:ligand-binding sensor domain-containing protein
MQAVTAGELPVRYLGIEQGLSNNAVISICQDHNGFLWIGTYDGLNRYDGYGFKVFHNVIGDSTSLAINTIYTIEEDNNRRIWVGGQEGLCVYNVLTSKFSKVRYTSLSGSSQSLQDPIHLVKVVNSGCVLVATQHSGLLVFENGSTTSGFQVSLNGRLSVNYDVTAIEQTPDHHIWVFVQNQGLFSYDPVQKKLSPVNNNIRQVNSLKTDRKGRLWLATDVGLFLYDPGLNSYSGNFMPAKVNVVTLSPDKQGVL